MPQSPFLVDALQIEPGSGNTLLLSRDSTTGSLKFVDAIFTSGVILRSMVGLRNMTGVYLVGQGGTGAPYTTIQSALDAIPSSSSPSAPALVLVFAGEYAENLVLQKDGVAIVGLGPVTILGETGDTVEISASTESTPMSIMLQGLRIVNEAIGGACVRILGADTFASGTVTVNNAPLSTGDSLTIGGQILTGVVGTRTAGADNFSVSSGTTDGIAAEIVAALNDPANSFAGTVVASAALNVITLTAATAGSGGNAITLAASTTPAGGFTLSGANLTGGGAAGSMVGSDRILIDSCELQAMGTGGFQVHAETVGTILVQGGSFRGSTASSLCSISNCALFSASAVEWMSHVEFAYDSSADRPDTTTSAYQIVGTGRVGDLLVNLDGEGSLSLSGCADVGDIIMTGTQTLTCLGSALGSLDLSGTTAVTLRNCTRSFPFTIGGSPTLQESYSTGFVSFAGTDAESVTFAVAQPDTDYVVLLDNPSVSVSAAVTSRTVFGFIVETSTPVTGDINYAVMRQLS